MRIKLFSGWELKITLERWQPIRFEEFLIGPHAPHEIDNWFRERMAENAAKKTGRV